MHKRRKPRQNARASSISIEHAKLCCAGQWLRILTDAGIPDSALVDRKGRPCPKCGGRDRFSPMIDLAARGAVLCRHCHNASTQPRAGDGIATLQWWLDVTIIETLQWLSNWLGNSDLDMPLKSQATQLRIAIPEPTSDRFALMADLCRRNMRNAWLHRAAELLGLPPEPLKRLMVGWSPAHRATTWPMRDESGLIVGIRLRCPTTAKKWAVKGSKAGLIFGPELLELFRPERLVICEGPTDTAALMSLGYQVIGVPSAGCSREQLAALCRRLLPVEIAVVADADGPGIAGAMRLAESLLAIAPVRVVSPVGVKDARAWIADAGVDRLAIESVINATVIQALAVETSQ